LQGESARGIVQVGSWLELDGVVALGWEDVMFAARNEVGQDTIRKSGAGVFRPVL